MPKALAAAANPRVINSMGALYKTISLRSQAQLPWITEVPAETVRLVDKACLSWIDFNKLQSYEHIQVLDKVVQIKGPAIILSPLSITHVFTTRCLLPVSLAAGFTFYLCINFFLQEFRYEMSDKTYRRCRWSVIALSAASSGLAFFALFMVIRRCSGIYAIHEQNFTQII